MIKFNIPDKLCHVYIKQALSVVRRIVLFVCSFLLFFGLYDEHRAAQVNRVPTKDRIVVVISLDGFPAYALDDPKIPLPTLRRLAKEGRGLKQWCLLTQRSPGPITLP